MSDYTQISQNITYLIIKTENAIAHIRCQHFWRTSIEIHGTCTHLNSQLSDLASLFSANIVNILADILKELLEALEDRDYVLLGDLLEMKLLPTLYDIQTSIVSEYPVTDLDYFEQNISLLSEKNCSHAADLLQKLQSWRQQQKQKASGNYIIEPTNSGALTLKKKADNRFYYYHSNYNPYREAEKFASSYQEPDVFHYVIIGLGLGYHAVSFLQRDKRFRITVVEPDISVIGMAFQYMNLTYLLSQERFWLNYSPKLADLGSLTKNRNAKLLIHYPTMMTLENKHVKELLNNYFIQMNSANEQHQFLVENLYYNLQSDDSPIDHIQSEFCDKTVIYIGGGPSAQTKLESIRKYCRSHEDTIAICAGTVYRRLLSLDFIPDFVIITDSQVSIVNQLRELPETKTRLIYLSTASRQAVSAFSGKRYIFFQQGLKELENEKKAEHCIRFETGGSVSTAAIDIALRLKCKKLITTGLDLSFPNNRRHGFEETDQKNGAESSPEKFLQTVDIYGNTVSTTPVLNIYKNWIEQRVKTKGSIPFINITDGVKIAGIENRTDL